MTEEIEQLLKNLSSDAAQDKARRQGSALARVPGSCYNHAFRRVAATFAISAA